MIREKSVFVFGAGAHCGYGFPSGKQLMLDVADLLQNPAPTSRNLSADRLHGLRLIPGTLTRIGSTAQLAEDLRHAGQGSIDAFIQARAQQEGVAQLLKAYVAEVLLNYEARHATAKVSDDWMPYLFRLLTDEASSAEEFLKNNVTFLTFNYDRFFEYCLAKMLRGSYPLDNKEAEAIVAKMPIFHLYGDLGSLQEIPLGSARGDEWRVGAERIRTIFEAKVESGDTKPARDAIIAAARIYIIGFGFHRENMNLIGLSQAITDMGFRMEGSAYATRFDMTDQEFNRGTSGFTRHVQPARNQSMNTLASLREFEYF